MLVPSPNPSRLARSQRSPISSGKGRSRFQLARICSASAQCAARSCRISSSPGPSDEGIELTLGASRKGLEKRPAPPLEAEQRPDEQAPVNAARGVLVEDPAHVCRVEELVDPGLRVAQEPVQILDALAAEPARVGGAEALLLAGGGAGRQHALHRLPQDELAVVSRRLEEMPFPRNVFVDAQGSCERRHLERSGEAEREFDELVVEEGDASLERVGHAQLVLHDEQAVQERLELEVERGVEVVVPALEPTGPAVKGAAEDIVRRVVPELPQDGTVEEIRFLLVGNEPLPEGVIPAQVVLAVVGDGRVVPPRVAAEELVAARSGEDDLDELARQPGDVVVRIALADAQVLQVPDQL